MKVDLRDKKGNQIRLCRRHLTLTDRWKGTPNTFSSNRALQPSISFGALHVISQPYSVLGISHNDPVVTIRWVLPLCATGLVELS